MPPRSTSSPTNVCAQQIARQVFHEDGVRGALKELSESLLIVPQPHDGLLQLCDAFAERRQFVLRDVRSLNFYRRPLILLSVVNLLCVPVGR